MRVRTGRFMEIAHEMLEKWGTAIRRAASIPCPRGANHISRFQLPPRPLGSQGNHGIPYPSAHARIRVVMVLTFSCVP